MQPDQTSAQEEAVLLAGLAICGFCGDPLRTELRGAGQVAYVCPGDGRRRHVLRSAPPVDGWVRLLVLEHIAASGLPTLPAALAPADLDALRAHSAALRTHLAQLTEASRTGAVDRSAATAGSERVAGELAAAQVDLARHATHELPRSLTGAGPLEVAWDRLGTERQRAILRRLTHRIAVHPVPPGRRPGDPDVLHATVVVSWVRR